MTICAATKWASNADMIVDIVELGYIRPNDKVIDLTFGGGKWWTKYDHPGEFTANFGSLPADEDLDAFLADHPRRLWAVEDFRSMPADTSLFDVVVFDPPYVAMGGRETSTMHTFMGAYGLFEAAATPELLQADNELGLREAMRITKPGGLILAKCAPYISSGVRKDGDWWARDAALAMGLKVEDMLIHVGDVRAQPKDGPCRKCKGKGRIVVHDGEVVHDGPDYLMVNDPEFAACPKCDGTGRIPRKVKHARNNYSVCFVFKKPKPRKKKVIA